MNQLPFLREIVAKALASDDPVVLKNRATVDQEVEEVLTRAIALAGRAGLAHPSPRSSMLVSPPVRLQKDRRRLQDPRAGRRGVRG